MINYLFSGIDKINGFNIKQTEYLKKDIKDKLNIVFIASTFNLYDINDNQYDKTLNMFKKIGIEFNSTFLIDSRILKQEAQDILTKSEIIYLMGGNPFLKMKSIKEYELTELIKMQKIVIGVSAGSMNQSKRVIYEDEKILDYEGLGIVDINIYPHLDFNNISLLKEIFKISKTLPLVALPNDSFVRIQDGNIEYIGEKYLINNECIIFPGSEYEKINHIGTIPLESDRLLYRQTTLEDIDEFFFLQLNPNLRKYLGTTKLGNDFNKNRIYFNPDKYEEKDFYRWTIVKKEDNKLLGTIYLNIHDEKAKTAGIDYWIREDEWGNGYITEASKCILEFVFNNLNLNRIESCGSKENIGTWKVMEKIGLQYEGERKQAMFYYYGGIQDLKLYGLTKEDYMKQKTKKLVSPENTTQKRRK